MRLEHKARRPDFVKRGEGGRIVKGRLAASLAGPQRVVFANLVDALGDP